MRTALGKVRGLGSARGGTHHFWVQRVSAIALVPLMIWLGVSLVNLGGSGHATLVAWMRSPLVASLLILTIAATFYHLKLGLQVIIEDYVHGEGSKTMAQLLVTFGCLSLGLLGTLSVLTVVLGAGH